MNGLTKKPPKADLAFRNHLAEGYALSPDTVDRLLDEVFAYYGENLDEVVRRRHLDLQRQGLRNEEIYVLLLAEAEERLFAPSPLSLRRIRRIVYG